MGRLTERQKLDRMLALIVGVSHPRVREILGKLGFDAGQEDEGWRLLRAAAGSFFAAAVVDEPDGSLAALDRWENEWLPRAQAALRRGHPAIERQVFFKLGRSGNARVILGVQLFLDRVDALAESAAPETRAARALLVKRGLNRQVVAEGRALVKAAKGVGRPVARAPAKDTRAERVAEAWAWYLEWSQIARTAIEARNLLALLGFGTAGRPKQGRSITGSG